MIQETERLQLRKFDLRDAGFIIELLNTPGWLQYIGNRNIHTHQDAENYLLNGPMKSYETFGFGLYMVQLKDGTPIGMCGLIKRDTLEHVDIGFAFLPAYAGQGYGYEAGIATMAHAKALGQNPVLAITLPENTSSIKLLEKLGLQFEKNMMFGEEELMVFRSR